MNSGLWRPTPAGFSADWLPGRIAGLTPKPDAPWSAVAGAERSGAAHAPDAEAPASVARASAAHAPDAASGVSPARVSAAPAKRPSAVLMLFLPPLPGGREARIVLTRRSTKIRSHRGQIGFPGGRAEPEDASPAATALRELNEEIGLAPGRVHTIGFLPPVPALDGSAVVTVVGAAAARLEELTIAPDEVEAVFAEPWTKFTRAEDRAFRFNIFGNWRDSHLFHLPQRPVWGLTAWILARCDFAG